MQNSKGNTKRDNTFLKGAFILSAAGLLVKFLGAFFRIPLGNMLSIESMGYYSAAYPIYSFFVAISMTGFPISVARLLAESKAKGNTATIPVIMRASWIVMGGIGAVGALVLFFFSGSIAGSIGNTGAELSLKMLAPAVLTCSLLGVMRGAHQGFQKMTPLAVSMIVEQFMRVVIGLAAAWLLIKVSNEAAAAGATLGAFIGAFASFIFIYLSYLNTKKNNGFYNSLGDKITLKLKSTTYDNMGIAFVKNRPENFGKVVKKMMVIAVPITISGSIFPLVNIIDVAMVVNRLKSIGYSAEVAKEMFTMLSGYAMTLINFPLAILSGIQISVVPAITAVYAVGKLKETRKLSKSAMKVTMLIAMPAAFGLSVLSTPIIALLYPAQADYIATTGHILAVLAFSVIFLGGFLVSSSVYQSIGRPIVPVQNLMIGLVFKFVLTYVLVGIDDLNIIGASIATIVCYLVAWILNMVRIRMYFDFENDIFRTYLKPLIASGVMALSAHFSYILFARILSKAYIATLLAILFAIIVYGVVVLGLRVLSPRDYEMLPAGDKIRKIEKKLFRR